jgi:hypothetical protein
VREQNNAAPKRADRKNIIRLAVVGLIRLLKALRNYDLLRREYYLLAKPSVLVGVTNLLAKPSVLVGVTNLLAKPSVLVTEKTILDPQLLPFGNSIAILVLVPLLPFGIAF